MNDDDTISRIFGQMREQIAKTTPDSITVQRATNGFIITMGQPLNTQLILAKDKEELLQFISDWSELRRD